MSYACKAPGIAPGTEQVAASLSFSSHKRQSIHYTIELTQCPIGDHGPEIMCYGDQSPERDAVRSLQFHSISFLCLSIYTLHDP